MDEKEKVGIILSGATTSEAACQLLETAEEGQICEGMLLLVITKNKNPLLARVAQIIPYNAFYTEGDPWSEPRRKGLPIPEEIARQYEICKLDLLIELPKGESKHREIKYPPRPGDYVIKIDPTKHEREIFGVSRDTSKFIWYGSLAGYGEAPVPLDVEKIPMHMAVFGTTGSGKSFDTGALIEKLADIPANETTHVSFPTIIIDANGDYLDYLDHMKENKEFKKVGWIRRYVFPNILGSRREFREDSEHVFSIGIDLDALSKREIAETILLYYKGTLEGAELQLGGIVHLLETMENRGFDSLHDLFLCNYSDLIEELHRTHSNIISPPTRMAIERAFSKFKEIEDEYKLLSAKKKSPLTKKDFVDEITRDGAISIIDFSEEGAVGVELRAKQLVMTYIATILFKNFTRYKISGEGERYLIFLIEEAQNFIPSKSYPIELSLAKNKLSLIATQGRKFGLSLCLITQRPSFVDKIALSMCNTFFIHRISPEDVGYVKDATGGLPVSLSSRLTALEQGELIITGQMNRVPFPLLINVPGRIAKHKAGTTDVVKRLAEIRGGEK